jgi:hypothetical protein
MKAVPARAILFLLSALMPFAAHANFIGQTVTTQFLYGATVYGSQTQLVPEGGYEFAPGSYPQFNENAYVNVGADTITVGQVADTVYSSGHFNGLQLIDFGETIISATLLSVDGILGFDASRLTFDANDVFIDFNGLLPAGAHSVVVAVRFSDSVANVPEPGTVALLGLALFSFAVSRRKSPRQAPLSGHVQSSPHYHRLA